MENEHAVTTDMKVADLDTSPESRVFRMGAANFMTHLVFSYAGPWLLALSATAVVGVAFGIAVDLRWFVVGMMVVFLVIPMLMGFMYYYYGLRRECLVNSVPHALVVEDDGIRVRMLFRQNNDDAGKQDGDDGVDENQAEPEYLERFEFFSYSDMRPPKIGTKSVVIPLHHTASGFLWIPFDAFGDMASLEEVLAYVDTRIINRQTN